MELFHQRVLASYSWACHYASCCTAAFASSFDREELKSVGILGYIVAANRYDENKGSSFRGFCATRIRGAIMDELRRSNWQPRSARRTHQIIAQAGLALEADLQRKPTHTELAAALDIEEIDLAQMLRHSQPATYVSLDDETVCGPNDEESIPLKEIIADQTAAAPSDACDTAEMRRTLAVSIGKLTPAEASVIMLYYLHNIPFHEIAQRMKVTPSRISQLHHHALHSLKKIIQNDEARNGI
jgi:RNA polymerase sigma factor for flagellar operon FliA